MCGKNPGARRVSTRHAPLKHDPNNYFFKNSKTSAGCASAFATGIQCFFTVPSGPIKAVERIGPSTVSPWAFCARSPCAIRLHHAPLGVGQQGERQVEFGDELVVGIDAVSAYAQQPQCWLSYTGSNSVAEPARFFGSARGIILRIKPQNDVLAGIIGERMFLAVAARQSKRRRLLSFQICHADLLGFCDCTLLIIRPEL